MDESPTFTTVTVGRIYLEQGKLDQAEEIFRRVLAERPDDVRSREGLAEVARRRAADAAERAADGVDLQLAAGELVCRWSVSPGGRHRAALVAGSGGKLVLRVAGFPAAPDAPPADTVLAADSGELRLAPPQGAHLVAAAVGLRTTGERFVAIAHTRLVPLTQ